MKNLDPTLPPYQTGPDPPNLMRPPGIRIFATGPELPLNGIVYDPSTRTFFWDVDAEVLTSPPGNPAHAGMVLIQFHKLTPEEISRYINDETMATCLALSLTQAR